MSYGDIMMSQKNAKIQTITKITKVRYKEMHAENQKYPKYLPKNSQLITII